MKSLMIVLLVSLCSVANAGPYVDSIFQHPANPYLSAGATFNSKFNVTGMNSELALVYHVGDLNETIIPQCLLDLGVKPVSYGLNAGVGGSSGNFYIPLGPFVNLTPTILGPLLQVMDNSGNMTLVGLGKILSSDKGGVAFGPTWTAYPVVGGTIMPFNSWRWAPGYFCGALYKFGK